MTQHIAIIGGGILGSMIAHTLLNKKQSTQVTLIEHSLMGSGASRFSAGVHFPFGRTPRVKSLSIFSSKYYADLLSRHPDFPIYPIKFLIATSPEKSHRMASCHIADVYGLIQKLLCDLRKNICVYEGTQVLDIAENMHGATLVLSSGKILNPDIVILTPGPWANQAPFYPYTQQLGIRIKKVVAFHINAPKNMDKAIFFPEPDIFFVPFYHRGHWLFSYTCQQWDVSPMECQNTKITNTELQEAKIILNKYAPTLSSQIINGRIFCDAYSPDREPIVKVVGKYKNIIFAGATNGSGYRLAPGIAAEAVKLLEGDKHAGDKYSVC